MSESHCPKCGERVAPISRELSDVLTVIRTNPKGVTASAVHVKLSQYQRTLSATMNLVKRLLTLRLIRRARKVRRNSIYVVTESK